MSTICDRPLAQFPLISYRCKGPYGWIMIGAKDFDDAIKEARRSTDNADILSLEIWGGSAYVSVYPA